MWFKKTFSDRETPAVRINNRIIEDSEEEISLPAVGAKLKVTP